MAGEEERITPVPSGTHSVIHESPRFLWGLKDASQDGNLLSTSTLYAEQGTTNFRYEENQLAVIHLVYYAKGKTLHCPDEY